MPTAAVLIPSWFVGEHQGGEATDPLGSEDPPDAARVSMRLNR
jgi:hypothetical protein